MEPSVFTKIINGDIPCHKVFEDERTLAFMDIYPAQQGQVVVVPKQQVPFVWDLEQVDYESLMRTVHKIGKGLRKAFPDKKRVGVTISGIDVDNHAHVVLLPFSTGSEFHAVADMDIEPNHEVLAALAEEIKGAL